MNNNRITQSIIIGIATLVAASTWAGTKSVLFGDGGWLLPSIGFLILLIFLGLNWLLTKSRAVLMITLVFIVISYFFVFGFKLEYLATLFIAGVFFVLGSFRAIKEKQVRIKIQVDKILRRGLPFILTALSLMIAIAYFFSPLALRGQDQIEVPRSLFNALVRPIMNVAEIQLLNNQIPVDFQESLYQTVNQEVNKYNQAHQNYLPLGLSIGIFLALRTISIPLGWLAVLLTWAIFRILVALGAVKIQEKAVLKQVIEI